MRKYFTVMAIMVSCIPLCAWGRNNDCHAHAAKIHCTHNYRLAAAQRLPLAEVIVVHLRPVEKFQERQNVPAEAASQRGRWNTWLEC
jgi:hypothetical protein